MVGVEKLGAEPKPKKYEPRFAFLDEGKSIVFINTYSGIECVYINQKEVYRQRKMAKTSLVEVEHDSNTYRFELDVKSALFGPVVCRFYKNNILQSVKKLVTTNIMYYYRLLALFLVSLVMFSVYFNPLSLMFIGLTLIAFGVVKKLLPIEFRYYDVENT